MIAASEDPNEPEPRPRVHWPTLGCFALLAIVLAGVLLDDFGTALGCSEGGESSTACYTTSPGYVSRHDLFVWTLVAAAVCAVALLVLMWMPALMARIGTLAPLLVAVLVAALLIIATARYLQSEPPRAWCVHHAGGGGSDPCATEYN